MALKKQFDFSVHGKGVLIDTALPLTTANLAVESDAIVINGISYNLALLDASAKTTVLTAVESIVDTLFNLTHTLSMGSASVANSETLTITIAGITVTYTNTSGLAVAGTSGALATAVKAACDANASFVSRFEAAVSGDNLVISQRAPYTKLSLAVVGGTGVTGGEVTVA